MVVCMNVHRIKTSLVVRNCKTLSLNLIINNKYIINYSKNWKTVLNYMYMINQIPSVQIALKCDLPPSIEKECKVF